MSIDSTVFADNPFVAYVSRIRDGDQSALEELVQCYTPVIRLEARMRLRSAHLRAVLDSMDICQSVLKSFFLRAAAGQFDIDRPEDLRRLLVKMACNKSLEAAPRNMPKSATSAAPSPWATRLTRWPAMMIPSARSSGRNCCSAAGKCSHPMNAKSRKGDPRVNRGNNWPTPWAVPRINCACNFLGPRIE